MHDYITTYPPGGRRGQPPVYTPAQAVEPIVRPDPRPRDVIEGAFLRTTNIPDIMTDGFPKANWKGVRVLGTGGFSMVGHWTYDKQQQNLPLSLDVAVKEVQEAKYDLKNEGDIMHELGKYSEHIVRLAKEPTPVDWEAEGLEDEWDGRYKRLIMEYCSQGTLDELLKRRIAL